MILTHLTSFMADLKRLSKFLALVLRHQADSFGLEIDQNGFTDLALVRQLIEQKFPEQYSYDDLQAVVAGDREGKKRYEIVDDQIRALFGHSQVTDIIYPIVIPPEFIFHGTSIEALASIKKNGLVAQKRQYVHCTVNLDYARLVANRHSQNTIVLHIEAFKAHENGIVFHQPEAQHFLCKAIPSAYILFDE